MDAGRPGTSRWAGRSPSVWFRVALLVGAGALLVAVAVGASGVGPWVGRPQTDPTLPSLTIPTDYTPPATTPGPPPSLPQVSGSGSYGWLLIVLAVVLALVLIVLLVIWWRQRQRPSAGAHGPDAPDIELLPVIPGGDLPFDPRVAAGYVVECWQSVERTAARAGYPRVEQQTPTEFLRGLADTFPMDRAEAARLLGLYHHARFDQVALSPDSAPAARDASEAICQAVAAAVVTRSAVTRGAT